MIKFKNIFLATMLVLAGGAGCAAPAYAEGESGDSTPATWLQISPTAATVTLMGGSTLVDNAENCPLPCICHTLCCFRWKLWPRLFWEFFHYIYPNFPLDYFPGQQRSICQRNHFRNQSRRDSANPLPYPSPRRRPGWRTVCRHLGTNSS